MFSPSVYQNRRDQLIQSMNGHAAKGLILFPANVHSPVNYPDNAYPFRQDSSFLYYFGHDTPGLFGVLDIDSGNSSLWGNELGIDATIWSGSLPTMQEQAEQCACSFAGSLADCHQHIIQAVAAKRDLHFLPPYQTDIALLLASLCDVQSLTPVKDVSRLASRQLIHSVVAQRSIKSPDEIAEIEQALTISHAMYERAMLLCGKSVTTASAAITEQMVAGELTGIIAAAGSAPSFTTICSIRGEVLHNHTYENALHKGNLLLIDSGAESPNRYASDITRTLPVGGTFTTKQQEIYQAVLDAQQAAISLCAPQTPFMDCHIAAATSLTNSLQQIGLMKGDVEESVAAGAHALFFPHGLGHMLGLDVHDMENLGENHVGYGEGYIRSKQFGLRSLRLAKPLQTGFVVTVEPGCYFIPPLIAQWEQQQRLAEFINYDALKEYMDFGGIRIEDDILITDTGYEVLGLPIPKTVSDLHTIMG